jgi:hypothetical protein
VVHELELEVIPKMGEKTYKEDKQGGSEAEGSLRGSVVKGGTRRYHDDPLLVNK